MDLLLVVVGGGGCGVEYGEREGELRWDGMGWDGIGMGMW